MKKIIKTAMFAFAVVAAGFGGIKTYQSYTANESTLMSANVEALSQDGGDYTPKIGYQPKKTETTCYAYAYDQYHNYRLTPGKVAACEPASATSLCVEGACML